jgi:hypothetical protein
MVPECLGRCKFDYILFYAVGSVHARKLASITEASQYEFALDNCAEFAWHSIPREKDFPNPLRGRAKLWPFAIKMK